MDFFPKNYIIWVYPYSGAMFAYWPHESELLFRRLVKTPREYENENPKSLLRNSCKLRAHWKRKKNKIPKICTTFWREREEDQNENWVTMLREQLKYKLAVLCRMRSNTSTAGLRWVETLTRATKTTATTIIKRERENERKNKRSSAQKKKKKQHWVCNGNNNQL